MAVLSVTVSEMRARARRFAALVLTACCLAIPVLAGAPSSYADDIRDQQWQLTFLRAEQAWPITKGEGVTVAVIDSGVDANHPDLRGQVVAGTDFVDGSTDGRSDAVGHGTAVAGIIAGTADDDDGVEGLAPQAMILPIRVLDPNNQYDSADDVANAIRWAVDHGASVINLSLGSADTSPVLTEALYYAFENDVVVVACNGNYSNDRGTQVWHPAREAGVLAVSGVGGDGEPWDGSLTGPQTVLAAPATDITGAEPGGGYTHIQGTSFAAPLVAAAAALVRSAYPQMSAVDVVNRLISTAWDSGAPGFDDKFGYGIVNPTGAITADVPHVARNPLLPNGNRGGSHFQGGPGSPRIVDEGSRGNQSKDRTSGPSRSGVLVLVGVILVACTATALMVLVLMRQKRGTPKLAGEPIGSVTNDTVPSTPPGSRSVPAPPRGIPPAH